MDLNVNLSIEEDKSKEAQKRERAKQAEIKKALKEYQPSLYEVFHTGYMTHTGKQKLGIFQTKISNPNDMKKLESVYDAIQKGELSVGVTDMKKFSKTHAMNLYTELKQKRVRVLLDKLVEETPDNYILVMDVPALHEMYEVLKQEEVIAVDTETTGLNLYGRDKIVGVSFTAPKADLHYYVPLRHDEANAPLDKALYWIGRILKQSNDKVFHNVIFDLHQFTNDGLEVKGKLHCTQNIMAVLNENEMSYQLKDLVPKYLKIAGDTFNTLFGKKPFNEVALKYARYYACKDTHITWLLFEFQMNHLKRQPTLYEYYFKVEQPLFRVVYNMEREGFIPVLDVADEVSKELTIEVDQLRKELTEILGEVNLESPVQLKPALHRVGIEVESTAKEELKKYKSNPIIEKLLEYREKYKLNKDFISKIREFIQPDGKVHGSFKQNGARTGRFSSKEPNLQQIPPSARRIYRVDDDSLILGLDFSAQEPKMLTHYTQEPILIDNYQRGRDLYATLASEFYGKPYEECYKNPDGSDTKERKQFKVVVLAIMYGMGGATLGTSLGISTKEAQNIIDTFYKMFPKVALFVRNNTKEACKQGFVEMKIEGVVRKRRLPFFKGKNPKYAYDTYSTNAKIQGTSAIQTKLCMIEGAKLCEELSRPDRTFALLACVHDELLFRVPKDVTREEVALFEKVMTETVKLNNVPNGSDGELGNCWGHMKPVVKFFNDK